ncbi:MAG: amidase domain-containing protein [Clostridium sp.]|jgi:hypothetical protein|nr:amidase domain-containing protein [Clostridium sp.]
MYNRSKAVSYAHQWAFARNPRYLDFSGIGGDCTNFISQCLHAGGIAMDYQKDIGWYYNSSYDRAPAWTSVQYLYQFMIKNRSLGPRAQEVALAEIEPGDVIQLAFDGGGFTHSLFVVEKTGDLANEVRIATHTLDSDYRLLSSYQDVSAYRYLKILND